MPPLQPPKSLEKLIDLLIEHLHWYLRISKPKTDWRAVYLVGIVVLFLAGYALVSSTIGLVVWMAGFSTLAIICFLTYGRGDRDPRQELMVINATELYWYLVQYYSEFEQRRAQHRDGITVQPADVTTFDPEHLKHLK